MLCLKDKMRNLNSLMMKYFQFYLIESHLQFEAGLGNEELIKKTERFSKILLFWLIAQ